MDLGDPCQDLDAGGVGEESPGDGARSNAAHGLAGAGPTAAQPVAGAVLGVVGEVGVGGPVDVLEVFVGLRPGIGVAYQHGDGGPESVSLEDAGEDLGLVALLALGGQATLARATSVEVALDVLGDERQAWRAAINDDSDSATMGLAPGGDSEQGSKGAGHAASIRCLSVPSWEVSCPSPVAGPAPPFTPA